MIFVRSCRTVWSGRNNSWIHNERAIARFVGNILCSQRSKVSVVNFMNTTWPTCLQRYWTSRARFDSGYGEGITYAVAFAVVMQVKRRLHVYSSSKGIRIRYTPYFTTRQGIATRVVFWDWDSKLRTKDVESIMYNLNTYNLICSGRDSLHDWACISSAYTNHRLLPLSIASPFLQAMIFIFGALTSSLLSILKEASLTINVHTSSQRRYVCKWP